VAEEAVVVHPTSEHAKSLQTALIDGAVLVGVARRHTDAIRTLHWLRTVRGTVTGRGDPNALNLRVSSEVRRTDALLLVADNVAEGVEPASSLFAARISTLTLVTHLVHLAVAVVCAGSCDRRLGTDEVFADAFADTVAVDETLFLLAANLLVVGITKETFRAGTDGLVALG